MFRFISILAILAIKFSHFAVAVPIGSTPSLETKTYEFKGNNDVPDLSFKCAREPGYPKHRDHERPSMEAKARGQLHLTPLEKKALKKFLRLIANLGNPMQIKCLLALAFSISHQRSTNKATKPPSKN